MTFSLMLPYQTLPYPTLHCLVFKLDTLTEWIERSACELGSLIETVTTSVLSYCCVFITELRGQQYQTQLYCML